MQSLKASLSVLTWCLERPWASDAERRPVRPQHRLYPSLDLPSLFVSQEDQNIAEAPDYSSITTNSNLVQGSIKACRRLSTPPDKADFAQKPNWGHQTRVDLFRLHTSFLYRHVKSQRCSSGPGHAPGKDTFNYTALGWQKSPLNSSARARTGGDPAGLKMARSFGPTRFSHRESLHTSEETDTLLALLCWSRAKGVNLRMPTKLPPVPAEHRAEAQVCGKDPAVLIHH
ncbi:hypothetical protein SKAU_G00008370 [Synaphobranchus kaupii]|uniref:Uncharacterized protein n=1 Tax=Synaphobranchus kaupii TaxID=118154 RepID=A0A9Q1G9H7_SYNKA|nr:hypothetical protein SKAU_G00008370 [Synaphobranchus kaupii]